MNNTNTKLMTAFLILGIIFFISMFVVMIKDEAFDSHGRNFHAVVLESIKVVKNDFGDSSRSLNNEVESEGMYAENVRNRDSYFLLVNKNDHNVYAKSSSFTLKALSAPQSVTFYDNAQLPQSTLNDPFQLELNTHNTVLERFSFADLHNKLKLESKTDNTTESQQLKLESDDHKLVLFLNFRID